MSKDKILSGVVALIGVYMVVVNIETGFLIPPVLSGVAFILIGVKSCSK